MPIKFPIKWKESRLVEADGTATPYLQRIFEQLFEEGADGLDIIDAELLPTTPVVQPSECCEVPPNTGVGFTGFIPPEAVQDIALLASSMVPMCMPSGGGDMTAAEVAALGYWAPVTDATDPMDPLFVFDAEGQCVVAFVPTP